MRIAQLFAASGQMRVLSLPFHVPSFDVNLYWKERPADGAPLQWFRETIHRSLVGRWQQAASLRVERVKRAFDRVDSGDSKR